MSKDILNISISKENFSNLKEKGFLLKLLRKEQEQCQITSHQDKEVLDKFRQLFQLYQLPKTEDLFSHQVQMFEVQFEIYMEIKRVVLFLQQFQQLCQTEDTKLLWKNL